MTRCLLRGIGSAVASATIVGVWSMLNATSAFAYRPFDGTDAAVADFGEVEVELQPLGAMHAGSTTKPVSDSVLNFGFAERWELVLQATAQPPLEGGGPLSVPDAAFLKYVVQPGVLQDKKGPSIAMEFGPLLPDVGGSGVGFSWSGIVSQRWDWGTVHFNIETNLTQDQHGELFFDAIIEGPNTWKVRPVLEIYSDSVISVSQSYSALAGAIWQVNDKLSLDIAFRYALVDGRPVNEVRVGMTFGFPLVTARPANAEASSMVTQARR
jgi:opacity protein-like surface antigen